MDEYPRLLLAILDVHPVQNKKTQAPPTRIETAKSLQLTLSHVDCFVNHPSYSGSFTSYMILVCVSTKGGRISREGAAAAGRCCCCGNDEKGGVGFMLLSFCLLPKTVVERRRIINLSTAVTLRLETQSRGYKKSTKAVYKENLFSERQSRGLRRRSYSTKWGDGFGGTCTEAASTDCDITSSAFYIERAQ